MKKIKKLSTKLIIALGVIILIVIVLQVIVSKRDFEEQQKIEQIKE